MPYNADPYIGSRYLYDGIANAGHGIAAGVNEGLGRLLDQRALKKFFDEMAKKNKDKPVKIMDPPVAASDYRGMGLPPVPPPAEDNPDEIGRRFRERAVAMDDGGNIIGDPWSLWNNPGGFQDGGFTGVGADDEPAGTVHRNEYVVPAPDVEAAGGPAGIEQVLTALRASPRAATARGFGSIVGLIEQADRHKEEERKISATGKALRSVFKANPDLLKQAGVMSEQLDNLGSREVMGLFEGVSRAQALKSVAEQIKQHQEAAQERSGIAADFSNYVAGAPGAMNMPPTDPRLGAYYEADGNEMPTRPLRPSAEAMAALAAQYPRAAQHPQFDNFIKAQESAGGPNWDAVKPREGRTTTGANYLYGKGGQFQLVPNMEGDVEEGGGIAPGRLRTLPDGSLQTYNGKTWQNVPRGNEVRDRKLSAEMTLDVEKSLQEIDKSIARWHSATELSKTEKGAVAPAPAALEALQNRRARIAALIEKSDDAAPAQAATPSAAPAMPKTQAEFDALPKGALYVNPNDRRTYRKN